MACSDQRSLSFSTSFTLRCVTFNATGTADEYTITLEYLDANNNTVSTTTNAFKIVNAPGGGTGTTSMFDITGIDLQPTGNANEFTLAVSFNDVNGVAQTVVDTTPVVITGGADQIAITDVQFAAGANPGEFNVTTTWTDNTGTSQTTTSSVPLALNGGNIPSDPATTGLVATDVDGALGELQGLVAAAAAANSDDQTATEVPYDDTATGLGVGNVQQAIAALAATNSDDQTATEVPVDSAAATAPGLNALAGGPPADTQEALELLALNTAPSVDPCNVIEIDATNGGLLSRALPFVSSATAPTCPAVWWNPTAVEMNLPTQVEPDGTVTPGAWVRVN